MIVPIAAQLARSGRGPNASHAAADARVDETERREVSVRRGDCGSSLAGAPRHGFGTLASSQIG